MAAAFLPMPLENQQPRDQAGWPCVGKIDPAYVRTAEATGGAVMLFQPTEVTGVVAEMSASRDHEDVVFRAAGRLIEGSGEFDIPIDTTIESTYFFVSVQCLQSVNLVRPDGEDLHTDAANVEYQHFEAIRLFTIKKPDPGIWKVRVAGKGFFSLIVKAKTDLKLTSATFVDGRLEAKVSGAANQIGFEFVSLTGTVIGSIDLDLEEEFEMHRSYGGEVERPSTDFRLGMTGTDSRGYRLQRIQNQLFLSP
jgi:hypothetical protein